MNINEIERVLAAEPRNVRALILKADHLANAGDARSASSYYLAALKAAGPPQQVARELLPELKRRGKAVVVITHDDRYFELADRVIELRDGRMRSGDRDPAQASQTRRSS